MDDLHIEHVESADKTLIQDQTVRFEEMAEFVNTRVYELVTEKMKGGNKNEVDKKDFMTARKMEICVDADTNEFVKAELLAALRTHIIDIYMM
ncbi:unnamed protein product [Peronospora belbahrii]|uniref:Uncharacterized protein n=1 Tax=Peronospora belbahrii TaxID=622444 RepID=A0AAU9L0T6_9STRA|nr:unnamed protein product [Peronospora belbahrii]